jgi:hypothetical protein
VQVKAVNRSATGEGIIPTTMTLRFTCHDLVGCSLAVYL